MTMRMIPMSACGRIVSSTVERFPALDSVLRLPDGEQVETGCQHDQARDNGTGAAVVFELKGQTVGPAHAAQDGENAEHYAGDPQQGEESEERTHVLPQSEIVTQRAAVQAGECSMPRPT